MSPISDELTLAVIGCGAVAEAMHVPAIGRRPGLAGRTIFVDPDLARAESLRNRVGGLDTAADYRDVLDRVDAAYVTAPHPLHYPIAGTCLRHAVHVLCEKPLAETAAEARELVEAAEESSLTLAVNNTRRLYPAFQKVRELVESGDLGELRRFSLRWGEVFDWPAATGFYFGASGSARGVLADVGAHALDLVCWWLGGKPEIVTYADDSFGGAEAVAHLNFGFGSVEGEVRLSWLSRYENRYVVEGELGRIEGGIYDWNAATLVSASGRRTRIQVPSPARTPRRLADVLLDDFLQAVSTRSRPVVAGQDVLPSIELIEECYRRRECFEMPWLEPRGEVIYV